MTAFKTLLFTLLVPATVTIYLPHWLLHLADEAAPAGGWLKFLGGLCIGLGVAIYGWCAWDFTFTGKGTPAPLDPPKELVVRGLYRYSRNPMYIGVLSILLGEALWFASGRLLGYAALVGLLFHLFITLYEEPHLQQTFGTAYQHYCQTVPRWLASPHFNSSSL